MDERVVNIIYGAEGQVGRLSLPKAYDLIFTDRRIVGAVVAKTGSARVIGQALGGVVGAAIAGAVSKGGADKRRASYVGLPLDTILASDKANFSAPFERVENPKVKGLVSKYLHMTVDSKKAVFKLPNDQVDLVRGIISRTFPSAGR